MERPLITVIVPIYNVEKYIDQCIYSLTTQTYKNLEIILIDDGSKDASLQKCNYWKNIDNRIRVIHTKNCGVSHAKNIGLSLAHGKYISFVDGDDWCDKNMYEIMLQYLSLNKADIHVSGYVVEKNQKTEVTLKKEKPHVLSMQQAIAETFSISAKKLFDWSLCDKIIKRSIIKNLRFDETLQLSEDQWFFWQLLRKGIKISYAPQMSYHYRMRKDSATHTPLSKKRGTYLDAMKLILHDAQNLGEEIQCILKFKYYQIAISVMKDIVISGNHEFDDVFQEEQYEIRKKSIPCLKKFDSLRSKIGIVYFILPKWLVWLLRPLLLKLE